MKYRYKGRVLLADDPGLGKSIQSLTVANHFRQNSPVPIVCPNTVKYGWENQVKIHTGLQSMVLEGTKPPNRLPLNIPPFIILNWDILHAWWEWLLKFDPKVVIGDEIQAIKSKAARRTKCFNLLCKDVPHLLFLSGTPIENRPAEFYPALHLLRPDLYPSFAKFGYRYCKPTMTPWGMKFDGASNTKELHQNLKKQLMIRRTKEQVLKDLPPLQRDVIPLQIENRESYEEAKENFIKWLYKTSPSKARKAANAQHFVKIGYLLRLAAELKLKSVMEWIDNFLETSDRKLAVFGYHKMFLHTLYDKYQSQAVLVDGGVKGRKRQIAIDAFAARKKIRLFIGNIIAAGTGINKLTAASDVAICELIWNPAKLLQVEARLHRIGQKNPVMAHYLVAEDTIEYSLCRALHQKQLVLGEILDGKEKLDFDVFESLVKDLNKKGKHEKKS